MKRTLPYYFFVLLLTLLTLPSCRYYTWVKDIYNQGEYIETPIDCVRQYWRAQHVYDQFSPLAHFDVLWLSDEVRMAYVQVHAQKHCLCEDSLELLKCRQREENKHYISFYILSAVTASLGSDDLSAKDSEWVVHLIINNVCYTACEIKEVELPTEYALFLCKVNTRYKRTYLVRFDATTCEGHPLITQGTPYIELQFNRDDRAVLMKWCLDAQERVIRQRYTDPDVLAYPINCTSNCTRR